MMMDTASPWMDLDSENMMQNPPSSPQEFVSYGELFSWTEGGQLSAILLQAEEDSKQEAEKDANQIIQKSQDLRSVLAALEYYNRKNGTKYELVEALSSWCGLYDSVWVHCNFKAKKAVCGESFTKLFFAELEGGESGLVPTYCRTLTLNGKTTDNCEMCTDGIIHPRTAKFHLAKRTNYERRSLRLRSNFDGLSPKISKTLPLIDLDSGNMMQNRPSSPEEFASHDELVLGQLSVILLQAEEDSKKEAEEDANQIIQKSQDLRSALAALEYYNRKNGTKYELVEALSSWCGLCDSVWVHSNFKAKKAVGGESSTKLFFAELEGGESGLVPTYCRILNGKTTTDNCKMCTDGIIHPRNGGFHMATRPNPERRSLRHRC